MQPDFLYLNREARWLDFQRTGLELDADGALQLAAVPAFANVSSSADAPPEGPGGIARDSFGGLYHSAPKENRVCAMGDCTSSECLASDETLAAPRGLAIWPRRNALYICDSGNRRVLLVDLTTGQIIDQLDDPALQKPVAIAVDDEGTVYVADTAAVYRFTSTGARDASFHIAVKDSSGVAIFESRVYVLDAVSAAVFVFDGSGNPIGAARTPEMTHPMGIAVSSAGLFVGDNALRRVLRFSLDADLPFAGIATGYEGFVAALFADAGTLLVDPGGPACSILISAETSGFRRDGILSSAAITIAAGPVIWHTIEAQLDPLPLGTQIQFFFHTGDASAPPEIDVPADWTAVPPGIATFSLRDQKAAALWIAARFTSESAATPVLRNLRVRFNHRSYLPLLPAIYNDERQPTYPFLLRFVSLFESFFIEAEDDRHDLPLLFDPDAAPADALMWLASWMGVDLEEKWDTAKQRAAIRHAWKHDAHRGTLRGLREAIEFETGLRPVIEEPILDASWWTLAPASSTCGPEDSPDPQPSGSGSVLGLTTVLGAADPSGAIVGRTATLDRSRILDAEDFGAPMFDELAHRFIVSLPAVSKEARNAAIRVIEREKPAHTCYQLASVPSQMRVGFQARLGIDTVIAGPPAPARLNQPAAETVLGGGNLLHLGSEARLGDRLQL